MDRRVQLRAAPQQVMEAKSIQVAKLIAPGLTAASRTLHGILGPARLGPITPIFLRGLVVVVVSCSRRPTALAKPIPRPCQLFSGIWLGPFSFVTPLYAGLDCAPSNGPDRFAATASS